MSLVIEHAVVDGRPVRLRDGRSVLIRSIRPSDRELLVRFHESLDAHSQYLRFFRVHPHLTDDEVERFTSVDHDRREGLVALELVPGEPAGALVAVGRYDRLGDSDLAEVAFVTATRWRGQRLASLLLHELAERARSQGINRFMGETLGENVAMRNVFRRSGFRITNRYTEGTIQTEMDLRTS